MLTKKYLSQPAAIASYDYTDIAEGTGIVKFMGFKHWVSGSALYALTTGIPYSNWHPNLAAGLKGIETKTAAITTGDALRNTFDFDLSAFNAPKIIRGTAYLNIPFAGQSADADSSHSGYVKCFIQHWDGTTPTTIGSAVSDVINFSGTVLYDGVLCMPITITQKQFKKGEILRVKVELWGYTGGVNGGYLAIAHDPAGRFDQMFLSGSTSFDAYIPFNLDL